MLYTIPKFKLNDLNKKLKRITNAGGTVNVEIKGEENVESTKTKGLYIPCYIMEVSGDYKHEGWEFIGTLEHTPNGNIIRVIKTINFFIYFFFISISHTRIIINI